MRPEILQPLFASIENVKGVGARYLKLVSGLCGGSRFTDVLWHLPTSLVDRTYGGPLRRAQSGRIWTGKVRVAAHQVPPTRKQPYRVVVEDDTAELILNFFKWYPDTLKRSLPVGEERAISGRLEFFNGHLQMNHPDYMIAAPLLENLQRVEPVYPLCAGVSNKLMNNLARAALMRVPALPEWQNSRYMAQEHFPGFQEALNLVHHPVKLDDLLPNSLARRRLAYDELLAHQLALGFARTRIKKQVGRSWQGDGRFRRKLIEVLGFELTGAQQRVLSEINTDMAAPYRMQRLLQGDVGSGKTVVAFMAMLNVAECGAQAAIMAPTEILAKQHYETMFEWAEKIGVRTALLTGSVKGKAREALLKALADGEIDVLIGTHALFTETVAFKDLALVVIDEQHRFGVNQRLGLSNKGDKTDILVMTATPIPRTLVLTQYGDMEYSKIDEVPKGRKPVDTRVVPLSKIGDVVAALARKIENGCRAYWVCPLVEETEKTDLAAAEERFASLQKVFGEEVGLVHGKMKEKEKDAVMQRFKNGELKLLVATTVIEVGVNVPEATLMVVEHAEHFGLAQLHQLRGRIKRGFEASTCILLYGYPLSDTARERLNIMKQSEDGFLIAEKDLELRGGGEILGTRQSGFDNFRLADLTVHRDLLYAAHQDAELILNTDKELETPRGQALKFLLYLFERDEAIQTYKAG